MKGIDMSTFVSILKSRCLRAAMVGSSDCTGCGQCGPTVGSRAAPRRPVQRPPSKDLKRLLADLYDSKPRLRADLGDDREAALAYFEAVSSGRCSIVGFKQSVGPAARR
jgi:hypothetical protein